MLEWSLRGSDFIAKDDQDWRYLVAKKGAFVWGATAWKIVNNNTQKEESPNVSNQQFAQQWCEKFSSQQAMKNHTFVPLAHKETLDLLFQIKVNGKEVIVNDSLPTDWIILQTQSSWVDTIIAIPWIITTENNEKVYSLFKWTYMKKWEELQGDTQTVSRKFTLKKIKTTFPEANLVTPNKNMTETLEKYKVADFLVQDKEDQDDTLHRPLFDVNMRLFNENPHYRALVLQACDYISYASEQEFEDYPVPKSMAAAELGIPFNIVCFSVLGDKKVIINPKITTKDTAGYKLCKTNCGSFNLKEKIEVQRPLWIDVEGFDDKGNKIGIKITTDSGTAEHEIEHNLGITIVDKAKELKKKNAESPIKVTATVIPDDNNKVDEEQCCKCNQTAVYSDKEVGMGNVTHIFPHCAVHHLEFTEKTSVLP